MGSGWDTYALPAASGGLKCDSGWGGGRGEGMAAGVPSRLESWWFPALGGGIGGV